MKKILLGLIFFVQYAYSQENPFDSLEKQFAAEKSDEKKMELLLKLVTVSLNQDLHKALDYAKQGVALADKTANGNWQPKFYEILGRVYSNLLQLDSAAIFLDKAMAGYKTVNNLTGQANVNFRISWLYKKKGDIEKGMKLDLEGLTLMEQSGDQSGICKAYNKITEDLTRQGRLKEALEYADKAIGLAKKTGIPYDMLFAYFIAANVYIAMGDNQQALDYYSKAVALTPQEGFNNMEMASLINSRGNALKRLQRYPESLKDYDAAYTLSKKMSMPAGISAGLANLGEVNLLMGNYEKALGYQLETIQLQEKDSDYTNLTENYIHASDIYEQMGDYKNALQYQKKALLLRDSIASVKSDAAMSELMTQYETKKKEDTIASQEVKLSQQRLVKWLGIGLAALLAGFLVFGYRSYRARTRSNRLLASRNAENELLLKEIHHRVKNNLEIVSGLLALQSAEIDDPYTKETMMESQNRVQSIGIVHQKLYQGTTLGAIEMKEYFLNLGESILDSFGAEKRITIECAMEKLNVDIDTAVPLGLIVNELLTNTLKYAFPKDGNGKVLIRLEKSTDGVLHLEVSDNGKGKSGLTKGTGFGGQLVALLTRQLRGTMREELTGGTRIFFDFKTEEAA
ncbi:MAG: tetratricopeptide repeat protein [Bacteroidota bacterium]